MADNDVEENANNKVIPSEHLDTDNAVENTADPETDNNDVENNDKGNKTSSSLEINEATDDPIINTDIPVNNSTTTSVTVCAEKNYKNETGPQSNDVTAVNESKDDEDKSQSENKTSEENAPLDKKNDTQVPMDTSHNEIKVAEHLNADHVNIAEDKSQRDNKTSEDNTLLDKNNDSQVPMDTSDNEIKVAEHLNADNINIAENSPKDSMNTKIPHDSTNNDITNKSDVNVTATKENKDDKVFIVEDSNDKVMCQTSNEIENKNQSDCTNSLVLEEACQSSIEVNNDIKIEEIIHSSTDDSKTDTNVDNNESTINNSSKELDQDTTILRDSTESDEVVLIEDTNDDIVDQTSSEPKNLETCHIETETSSGNTVIEEIYLSDEEGASSDKLDNKNQNKATKSTDDTKNSETNEKDRQKSAYVDFLQYNYKNATPTLLKLLGFNLIESHYSRKKLKEVLKEKTKNANVWNLFLEPEDKTTHKQSIKECATIYSSNWPTWMRPFHVNLILQIFTTIYEDKEKFYVEMLTYSDTTKALGAFLIHLPTNEGCMKVFRQLSQVNLFNTNIKVDLDIGYKIADTVCESGRLPQKKWFDLNLPPRSRFRIVNTSTDAPEDYRPDPYPSKHCLRLNPEDPLHKKAINYIIQTLKLEHLPMDKNKEIIKKRTENNLWKLNDPGLIDCKGIYLKQLPTWFEAEHFIYVVELMTDDFDWHYGPYFMEILQYSNGKNMGAALIRFNDQVTCYKIFKQLLRIRLLRTTEEMMVELDIDDEIGSQIKAGVPEGIWQSKPEISPVFRNRYSVTYMKMPDNFNEDTHPHTKDVSELDVVETDENASIKIDKVMEVEDSIEIKSDEDECAIIENDSSDAISVISEDSDTESQEKRNINKSKCKIVYVKNLFVRGDDCFTAIKNMIKINTMFNPDDKYFFIKTPATEDYVTPIRECYLKFLSNEDAVTVATGLDGTTFRGQQIEASLYVGSKKLDRDSLTAWIVSTQLWKRKADNDLFDGDYSRNYKRPRIEFKRGTGNAETSYLQSDIRSKEIYGLNQNFLRGLGLANKPLSNAVLVSNLYEDATESKLREVFSFAGEIRKISLDNDKNTAIIEYDHPVEAVQAISMLNKQTLYDKEMNITLHHIIPRSIPKGLSGFNNGFGKNGEPLKGVRANRELRAVYELFEKIGVLKKIYKSDDPFLVHYRFDEAANINIGSDKETNKLNPKNTKPDVDTAIEALGTVLVALDLIPETTDCKNLISIVDALKSSPKVKSRLNKNTFRGPDRRNDDSNSGNSITYHQMKNEDPSAQTLKVPPNADPDVVEALQKALFNFMQNLKNNTGNIPADTELQFVGPNFAVTGNQNPPNFSSNVARVTPSVNPKVIPATNINPGGPNMRPGGPNMNAGRPKRNPGGPNMHPGGPNMNAGRPNMNPGMINTNPSGPNIHPGGPNMNAGRPNMNPGVLNMNPSGPNMHPGGLNINPSGPNMHPGGLNMNPGGPNMNAGRPNMNSGMPNRNPGVPNVHPGGPNMNAGMPNMSTVMPNLNAGMQNINAGMPNMNLGMPNMNPVMRNMNPSGPNMNPGIPNMNPGIPNINPRIRFNNPNMQHVNPGGPNRNPGINSIPPMPNPPIFGDPRPMPNAPRDIPNQAPTRNRTFDSGSPIISPGTSPPEHENERNSRFSNVRPAYDDNQRSYGQDRSYARQDDDWLRTDNYIDDRMRGDYRDSSSTSVWKEERRDADKPFGDNYEDYDMLQFSNLPPSVTKLLLTKKMEEIGEVVFTEMTGVGKALVRFKWPRDAERCKRLFHRSRVDGCTVDVKLV